MRTEKGFSLIETSMALALLALVAISALSGLATSFGATMVGQERVATDSLAKSQLEDIKAQEYVSESDYNPNDPDKRYEPISIPADLAGQGYAIQINPPVTIIDSTSGYLEIQSVSVKIQRNGEEILTISSYKLGRAN